MPPTGNEHKSPLQTLPAEIRNDIFALALTESQPLAVCTDDYPRPDWRFDPPNPKIFYALTRPASELQLFYEKYGNKRDIGNRGFWLLWQSKLEKRPAVPRLALTCRQFFCEAMPVFHAVNGFVLSEVYSEGWATAWFAVLKRLAGLEANLPGATTKKRTMRVEHVRINVGAVIIGNGEATDAAGKIHIMRDLVGGRLLVSWEGTFEDPHLCMCAVRDFAAEVRGEECVEEFVRWFEGVFFNEVEPVARGERNPLTRCERCNGREWETWKSFRERTGFQDLLAPTVEVSQSEMREEDWRDVFRQRDIRDYFARLSVK